MKIIFKLLLTILLSFFCFLNLTHASIYEYSKDTKEVHWKLMNIITNSIESGSSTTEKWLNRLNKINNHIEKLNSQTNDVFNKEKYQKLNVILGYIIEQVQIYSAYQQGFEISVIQDGEKVEIINNEITLSRSPFDIVISSHKDAGIFLRADMDDNYYNLVQSGDDIYGEYGESPFCMACGFAEYPNNQNNEIIISSPFQEGQHYFVEDRYNNTYVDDMSLVGTRTVENIVVNSQIISIEDFVYDLHIMIGSVFNYYNLNTYDNKSIVTQKELFKIKFKD